MVKEPERVNLDTNLWISFLINKDFSKLDELLFSRKCILVFSEELLEEFVEVVQRPKFRAYFSSHEIAEVLGTIHDFADFVSVENTVSICRDPKDNFLLALSLEGRADFLITGDKDLLALETIGSTKIVLFKYVFRAAQIQGMKDQGWIMSQLTDIAIAPSRWQKLPV